MDIFWNLNIGDFDIRVNIDVCAGFIFICTEFNKER